jgi:hypothetical protein
VGRPRPPWLILLAVALLVGTVAAFTYTEHLKLERRPVEKLRVERWLSPVCDCSQAVARVTFDLRSRERVTVTVVDSDGEVVRELASALRRPAGPAALAWDGRDDAGSIVPDGAYTVEVRLLDERRTFAARKPVNVDTRAPLVTLESVSPTAAAPGEPLELVYEADEKARALFSIDGEQVAEGPWRRPGPRTLGWPGLVDGQPLSAGPHAATLQAVDRAGNVSAPTSPLTITVTPAP